MPHPSLPRLTALASSLALMATAITAVASTSAEATTVVPDAGGFVKWDINDDTSGAVDDGSIATGYTPFGAYGKPTPFDGFGALRASVRFPGGSAGGGRLLRGFGLSFDGVDRWTSTSPVTVGGVRISRSIRIDAANHWVRYVDSVTNTAPVTRRVALSFGGSVGYSGDGFPGLMTAAPPAAPDYKYVAATSSGDTALATDDAWAVLSDSVDGTSAAPAKHGPSGVLFGAATAGFGDFEFASTAFTKAYEQRPRKHSADFLGIKRSLSVAPGTTVSVVHFVTAASAETPAKDGDAPTTGQSAAAVQGTLQALAAAPPLSDLPSGTLCTVRNFDVTTVPGYDAATCAGQRPLLPTAQPYVSKPTTSVTYKVAEKSVSQLLADLAAGRTTSVQITQAYIDRIAAFDSTTLGLNSYLYLDVAGALAQARKADAARAVGAKGALLGIPVGLKDLYDTKDMPTTAGSLAFAGSRPTTDATAVARLRSAGAVILGKLNLSEFAWSGNYSQSGVGGSTYNPYDLDRSAAGSSGGTGASTAASLNAFSMGTDSCGSLQGVSGVTGLATIRATRGLTSLAGVFPLEGFQDSAGPMTRTVTDLATALTVLAGTDTKDPLTKAADAHVPAAGFGSLLTPTALKGKRLGYLDYFPGQFGDPAAEKHFGGVLTQLRASGAKVLPMAKQFNAATAKASGAYDSSGVWSSGHWRYDIDTFLKKNPGWTQKNLAGIASNGAAIPFVQGALDAAAKAKYPTRAELAKTAAAKAALARSITRFMTAHKLDALVYPTNADDSVLANGDRGFNQNCQISANSGLPGVTVATGVDGHGLPVGLEFLGKNWSDGKLLALAYSYEQAAAGTMVGRKAPKGYGNLPYAAPAR